MDHFEVLMREYIEKVVDLEHKDPSHDVLHVDRVVNVAKIIGREMNANLNVIVPAAYLHDCVYISKTDTRRKEASRISADKAIELLSNWNYPSEFFPEVHHAILAHSYSAGIPASTLEAKIVQDADRLEALGAIGIIRCFTLGGMMGRPLYSKEDPFCITRKANDQQNTLDHFYVKLLGLVDRLHTPWAKKEGLVRTKRLQDFLYSLQVEMSNDNPVNEKSTFTDL